jgi:hypothetical protein
MKRNDRLRTVQLLKLSVPGKEPGSLLEDAEVTQMIRHGLARASHNLWLAERYLTDISKLGHGEELDDYLKKLSEVAEFIEFQTRKSLKRKATTENE